MNEPKKVEAYVYWWVISNRSQEDIWGPFANMADADLAKAAIYKKGY